MLLGNSWKHNCSHFSMDWQLPEETRGVLRWWQVSQERRRGGSDHRGNQRQMPPLYLPYLPPTCPTKLHLAPPFSADRGPALSWAHTWCVCSADLLILSLDSKFFGGRDSCPSPLLSSLSQHIAETQEILIEWMKTLIYNFMPGPNS